MPQINQDVRVWDDGFKDLAEFMNPMIENATKEEPVLWINMIERGDYVLGQGTVKKLNRFHGDVGDQQNLSTWTPIQSGIEAAAMEQGNNPCKYSFYLVDSGTETVEYTGFETYRRTKDICLNNIKFNWEFAQQLTLRTEYLMQVTRSIWENQGREEYINKASKYVLTGASPEAHTFVYDPYALDADGDSVITFDAGLDVGMLNPKVMDHFTRKFSMSCRAAAMSMADGQPLFGFVTDLDDFDDMIERQPNRQEDFRYYNAAEMNVHGFMSLKRYRGNLMIHDIACPRFKFKSSTATTVTLKRISPFVAEDTTIGQRWVVNPEYLNAEYTLSIYFLKDVFKNLIPKTGPGSVPKDYTFGTEPTNFGEFKWVNIPDREENVFMETGFHAAKFQAFVEPGRWYDEAAVLLHRRAPNVDIIRVSPGGDEAADSSTLVHIATTTSYAISATAGEATITLAQPLGCESPALVTVTDDNGATVTAVIAEDHAAPTYTIYFPTNGDRPANADMNDTAVAGITCA